MIKINLNAQVSVELTEAGVIAYNKSFHKLLLPAPINIAENRIYQEGDQLVLPLWEMMQIFGSEFFNGALPKNLPFKGNNITIVDQY